MRKPRPGSTIRGSLVTSAAWIASVDDAARDYRERRRLGEGSRPPTDPNDPTIVYVSNDTGADRARGEILEIGNYLLTRSPDEFGMWFSGGLRSGAKPCGILLHDLKDGKIGPLRIAGLAIAAVDVLDEDHTHAYAKSNDANPQSNFGGPLEFVFKPSGTGLKTCVVRFCCPQITRKIVLDEQLDANDSALASFYVAGADLGSELVHFNWEAGATPSFPAGTEGKATWFDDEEKWVLVSTAGCGS